jgi:hypothetical protein
MNYSIEPTIENFVKRDIVTMHTKSYASDSDIIRPSSKANKLFDADDSQYLIRKWQTMIESSHLSTKQMREALSDDDRGKEMLKQYSNFQLMNHLKYERRKCVAEKKE